MVSGTRVSYKSVPKPTSQIAGKPIPCHIVAVRSRLLEWRSLCPHPMRTAGLQPTERGVSRQCDRRSGSETEPSPMIPLASSWRRSATTTLAISTPPSFSSTRQSRVGRTPSRRRSAPMPRCTRGRCSTGRTRTATASARPTASIGKLWSSAGMSTWSSSSTLRARASSFSRRRSTSRR